ncbi:MAG TPA: VOC family protein [Methylomusa anaerophila]|uniref:Glyoxalase-like domain protein n=1 Tax=Methylomusa anaerophila TaxID=1930071 RepID=A0A348AK80_9FIRM|nr:VOC family protein [Methylomusa anaerophila]BBB91478.1 glyoxalase-like domain protein [Methylomusa anaerophila]HML89933.1 VOC family protein [Methylomusa anaerophila]
MQIKRVDSTISTDRLQESKEYYIKYFQFQLVYESDWYIELLAPGLPTTGISFVLPQRDAGEFFFGKGLILSFEVEDVDAEYRRLTEAGLDIVQELQDKPWGERSFVVDDPNGVHLYIYESIPATPEYQKVYDTFK